MPDRIATHRDWNTRPMPDRCIDLPMDLSYSNAEWDRIRRGVIPEQMEDKWFVFAEEGRVFFHRSWTGFCTYIADFERVGDRHALRSVRVNRDPEQYGETDDAEDRRLIRFLIDTLLLRRVPDLPAQDGEAADDAALRRWSLVGRAGFPGDDSPS